MAASFTDLFGIDEKLFDATGAFDPIIGIDSKLFVDPRILEFCEDPEFLEARGEVEKYFSVIITLLQRSEKIGDLRWNNADKLLTFRELKGTCLGYCRGGNSGGGIGKELRGAVLESVRELIEDGLTNPCIFEILGVFQEGIGCDRISDLISFILRRRIASYTSRVSRQVGYPGEKTKYLGFDVPKRPGMNEPILLLPKSILHPLPVAYYLEDIASASAENESVRKIANEYFIWPGSKKDKITKSQIHDLMRRDHDFVSDLLRAYEEFPARQYDFERDSYSEVSWYKKGLLLAEENPLRSEEVGLQQEGSKYRARAVSRAVCLHFKKEVEANGAWQLLYCDDRATPRKEKYAQRLFAVVAGCYCDQADIDISPESDSGNGPVDFKFSRGASDKCLVELKMSGSSQLEHCLDTQLPAYMNSEQAEKAIYLLVQTGNDARVDSFHSLYSAQSDEVKERIELVIVDARPKVSASKR